MFSDVHLGRDFVPSTTFDLFSFSLIWRIKNYCLKGLVSNRSRTHFKCSTTREKFKRLCRCDRSRRNTFVWENNFSCCLTLLKKGPQRLATIRKDKQHYKTIQIELLVSRHRLVIWIKLKCWLVLFCSKFDTSFQAIEIKNSNYTIIIDLFTPNTYIMVVISDPRISNKNFKSHRPIK